MEIVGIPLHDIILVLAGLSGIYFVIMLLRLTQIGRRRRVEVDIPPVPAPEADDERTEDAPATYAPPAYAAAQPAEIAAPPSFSTELSRSHLEREVTQLREEIVALRAELDEIKAARRVSPQYADAMALVQRGLTAQDVADRCGISLAEAELVWALARGPQNFDQEDDYGGQSGRTHARSA